MDRASAQLVELENVLLKAAEGYKGTTNIKQQLLKEAAAKGVTGDAADTIVSQVLRRLQRTERNGKKTGSAFGVPHKAVDQTQRIRETIQRMKDY